MNISKLTTQEKSAMLAGVMGWHRGDGRYDKFFLYDGNNERIDAHTSVPDLYLPLYMPLAWRVLNWGLSMNSPLYPDDPPGASYVWARIRYVMNQSLDHEPAVAQAAWLDEIIELAIAAGLVESQP